MKLKLLMTIFMVTSIFFNSKAEEYPPAITIMGDNTACTGEVYTYSVLNDPTVYYGWTITNGTFVSAATGSNSVDVAWYDSGTITVSTYSDPGLTSLISSASMTVAVDVLDPYITMDPEVGCLDEKGRKEGSNNDVHKEENDCHKACEDNLITYYSNGNPGSTFTWQAIGDVNVISSTSGSLKVKWLSVGFGVVILTETSANGCVAETEICVEIIPKPKALFDVLPGLTVCVGQTVYFEDLSLAIGDSDLTAWEWTVSDGTFQSYTESTDFSHVFNSGGNYAVNLRVYNSCGCYDDYKVEIKVIEEPGPEIFCPKVVCPNEKTEIYTNSTCGNYFWAVDNGTIVSGLGTSSITVMWDDEPSGVGYVYLSTPCGACNIPTVLEIPIVGTNLDIDGPVEVCLGDQVTLTAPMIPGTFYTWSVSPSPTGAVVVQEIHNQVIIEVNSATPITVELEYFNELAGCGDGCGGTSSHTMIAVAPSNISGPDQVCVGDSETYYISGPATGNIKVERPNGSISTISDGSNFNFTLPGLHIFTPNNAGCQGPPLLVNAHANPPAADFITGPTSVCAGIPYEYEAGNDLNGTIYSWTVTGGTPATGVGKEIAVTWTSTPYILEVKRINIATPNCESPPITYNVSPLTVSPSFAVSSATVCANQSYTYALDYLDGEEYSWSIAAEGQGSVITDPNSPSVDILWNNTTGTAVVTGSVRKCNVWYDVNLTVTISPVTNVTFTPNSYTICQNQSVTFNATSGFSTYDWSIDPMVGGPIPNASSFSRTFTSSGTFNVTLVATDICGNISMHSEAITVLPEPPSQLSITANTLACSGGVVVSGSATLVTSIIGGTAGHSFVWRRNGILFGGTLSTQNITNTGTYQVTVTNTATGCTAVETIIVNCPSGPPCTMPASNTGTFAFSYDNVTCGEVEFNQTSVSAAPGWSLGSSTFFHNGAPNTFSGSAPSYTYSSFDEAGYYNVTNRLCFNHVSLPSCCKDVSLSVPIPVVAEASANAFCDMSGTYMIKLDDFSSALGDLAGYDVTWYVNGGVVSTMTGVPSGTTNVGLGGLSPGSTYPVVLQVNVPMGAVPGMPSAYQCEFATSVVIPALPDATFTNNSLVCEDLDVEFVAATNGPNSNYEWAFGDGASLLQTVNTAARKYDGPMVGGYNVTLTVTNSAGCTDTYTDNVNVVTNDFSLPVVDVSPMTPICKPFPATLTFSHSGGATATSFAWSDGASGNPNVVFDAGGYIVTATDGYGCTAVSALTPVDIRPSPSAVIFGDGSYCFDADLPVELFGYAGPGLTYQWRKKPFGGAWSNYSTNANITDNGVTPGNSPYDYELTVTDPATGCSAITIKTIDIHAAPPIPGVNQSVVNCDPFTIELDATTAVPSPIFNWSNGASGTPINVSHGGLFEVTLTDGNGCSSTRLIDVEGAPNLDFFPVGCYVYCREDMPLFYPGPYGYFDIWKLYRDGVGIQSGTGAITNLSITDEGKYHLEVVENGCTYETGILQVEFDDEKCKDKCKEKCELKLGKIYPEHIQDCLYDFTVDIYLGECTKVLEYKWTVNNVPVPGGANMSYVFPGAGGTYQICVYVIAVDEYGNKCEDKICFKFTPTCKCDCDVAADFDIVQENCEFKFISKVENSKCTEIIKYIWTIYQNGKFYDQIAGPSQFGYGFDSQKPFEVCLHVIGSDGESTCEDIVCKNIFPCNEISSSSFGDIKGRDQLDNPTITLSPNPVYDNLRIESNGKMGKEWHVVIIDISGRLVSNNTVTVDRPYLIMSTAGWKNGMYQVSISDELGNRFMKKVIKVD